MSGKFIKLSAESGAEFEVYFTGMDDGPRPGLIVCSEAFGVNGHMRAVADRFATQGFIVAVPDMLWRLEPRIELPYDEAGLRRASEIADAFDKEQGAEDLRPVLSVLRANPNCNGNVGVLGFCIGGAVAYLSAVRLKVDACVSYYGKGIELFLSEADALACPTVLHYAGADRFIPESTVSDVRRSLGSKPQVEIYDYPGVDHGFNSEDRRAYSPANAKLAMERTIKVLHQGLWREQR